MRDHAKRRRQALARALAITVTIGGTAPALAHDPAPALHATLVVLPGGVRPVGVPEES